MSTDEVPFQNDDSLSPTQDAQELFKRLACLKTPNSLQELIGRDTWLQTDIAPLIGKHVDNVSWVGVETSSTELDSFVLKYADNIESCFRPISRSQEGQHRTGWARTTKQQLYARAAEEVEVLVRRVYSSAWSDVNRRYPGNSADSFHRHENRRVQLVNTDTVSPAKSNTRVDFIASLTRLGNPDSPAMSSSYAALVKLWCAKHSFTGNPMFREAWIKAAPSLMHGFWSARLGEEDASIVILVAATSANEDQNRTRVVYSLKSAQHQRRALGLQEQPLFGVFLVGDHMRVLSSVWVDNAVRNIDHEVNWDMGSSVGCLAASLFMDNIYKHAATTLLPEWSALDMADIFSSLDKTPSWRAPCSVKFWYEYYLHGDKEFEVEEEEEEYDKVFRKAYGCEDPRTRILCPECANWIRLDKDDPDAFALPRY
ncbi:hypothetical protein EIP91_011937 [Steccherinum ochraceum]|uniref:Uncharacterized protein n=1 Tax=Steccherinum ochraceum TaxID=92696 RepID=A0A4R0RQX1_9APHY|nr:hypothetical protein EIP91_011937 [Steccherinum ochraceum]